MKKLTLYALVATFLFGLALSQVSYAQVDPTGNLQNRSVVKPNFIDEDGDGICDNNTGGTGTGQMGQGGQGQGQGGQGSGSGNGTGIHLRLRDGSCIEEGTMPVAAPGSGATNNRQGRSRSAAPSK